MKLFCFLAVCWLCANTAFAQTKIAKDFIITTDAIYCSDATAQFPAKEKLTAAELKVGKTKLDAYYSGEYKTKEGYTMKWTLLFNKKNNTTKVLILDKNNLHFSQFAKYYGDVKLNEDFWSKLEFCGGKDDAGNLNACIQERVSKFFK